MIDHLDPIVLAAARLQRFAAACPPRPVRARGMDGGLVEIPERAA